MTEEEIIRLLIKKQEGSLSQAETSALEDMLHHMEDLPKASNSLVDYWDRQIIFKTPASEADVEASLQRVLQKTAQSRAIAGKDLFWKRISVVAACILLLIAVGFLYRGYQAAGIDSFNIVATKKGSKSSIILPDGTKVWLNADTKLSYKKSFSSTNREIYLSGEAYFDVTHDARHPFIVHTKTMNVEVLGTAFNVRAYQGEQNTQATLIRGKVVVSLKNTQGKKIVLEPNEKVIVQNDYMSPERKPAVNSERQEISIISIKPGKNDSLVTETQWVKNRLAFDQQPLADIAVELERWYNIPITIKDSLVGAHRFSGIFENKSLEQVLLALKTSSDFHYVIDSNQVIIGK